MLVHLVGHDERVVPLGEPHDQLAHVGREHGAGRIVRVVHEDRARAVADRIGEPVEAGLEVRPFEGDGHELGAREGDDRRVRVVERLEHDDLVARFDEREQRRAQRLRRAGRHEHLAIRIHRDAVVVRLVPRDRLAQPDRAAARRVLVLAAGDRLARLREHLGRRILVGEPLPEVDRARRGRERRHLGEDRRGDVAAFGQQARCIGRATPGSGARRHAVRLAAPISQGRRTLVIGRS